jgi:hypothetical protein
MTRAPVIDGAGAGEAMLRKPPSSNSLLEKLRKTPGKDPRETFWNRILDHLGAYG